ncbi:MULTISPECIES: hypothetical protein [unclassified Bradyrhizobium]
MIKLDKQQEDALRGLAGAIGIPAVLHFQWLKGMTRGLLTISRWRDRKAFDAWDKRRIRNYARQRY